MQYWGVFYDMQALYLLHLRYTTVFGRWSHAMPVEDHSYQFDTKSIESKASHRPISILPVL